MTELLTAAQMRAIEAAAIASGEVTGLELMERAGRGTVEAILAEWPELASGERRAVVLCGPGNNGGDGFVVARLLSERGWSVEVFLYGDPEKLPPDARANWERWGETGDVRPLAVNAWSANHLVVDALFGTGLSRPITDPVLWETFWLVDDALDIPALLDDPDVKGGRGPRTVALDLPSGLDADSGRILGGAPEHGLRAPGVMMTVAFHRMKPAHVLADGAQLCGRIATADLGLTVDRGDQRRSRPQVSPLAGSRHSAGRPGSIASTTRVIDPARLEYDVRKLDGHKYDHGHALILSGGVGRGGAARMAARGALRIGAGLVTLGCPPAALMENASRVDAVMTRPVRGAEGLAVMLEDERLNAVALGPGLGTGAEQAELVRVVLGGGPGPARGGAASAARRAHDGERDAADGSAAVPGSTRDLDSLGGARGDRGVGSEAGAVGDRGADPGAVTDSGGSPGSGAGAAGGGGPRPPEMEGGGAACEAARRRAVVLDADALTILAAEPDVFALLHERCVLTPHAGEFARLFPDIAERLDAPAETGPAYSKVDAAREAAARAGCVVLLKGPDTVIAHPDGRAAINSAHYDRSAPWLATAGAGDVLAGFVAGLLARGLDPMRAAEAAAWLHVECALEFGPGLIAEDLPEQLPAVLRRLGA